MYYLSLANISDENIQHDAGRASSASSHGLHPTISLSIMLKSIQEIFEKLTTEACLEMWVGKVAGRL